MYLWRKRATSHWLANYEEQLRAKAGNSLAVIELADRKRLCLEVACRSERFAQELIRKFGGGREKLPQDWLEQFRRSETRRVLRIGRHLMITNVGGTSVSRLRTGHHRSRPEGPSHIVIPPGAAFGTGEHVTTAMSLRLLEKVIRLWGAHAPRVPEIAPPRSPGKRLRRGAEINTRGSEADWHSVRSPELVVDLGTGSGILALAARRLGAKRAIAIDLDPIAISTAKANARLNQIAGVKFEIADARRYFLPRDVDILTANLFSELLIEVLPKLRRARWLILSGVMRDQEADLKQALKRNQLEIVEIRRRGKWLALLGKGL